MLLHFDHYFKPIYLYILSSRNKFSQLFILISTVDILFLNISGSFRYLFVMYLLIHFNENDNSQGLSSFSFLWSIFKKSWYAWYKLSNSRFSSIVNFSKIGNDLKNLKNEAIEDAFMCLWLASVFLFFLVFLFYSESLYKLIHKVWFPRGPKLTVFNFKFVT